MAIEDDVLVIGGGLAGATAALAAAEHDADVRLLSYKQSTLRHASGLIDVLGYTPAGEGPLAEPFEAIPDLPEGHPYERVGVDAVREALLFFDAVAGDAYSGAHTESNALVPTSGGTVKPTARYPAATEAGLASDPRDTLLVGFHGLPDFDAPLAADHLEAAGVPFAARGVTLPFPGIRRDDAKVTRYAHILDRDTPVDTGVGEAPARTALAETVRPHLESAARVGFPPILGDENAGVVRRDLEERLGIPVFEVPSGPPSLPGMRLEDLLYGALGEAGVRVTTGVPVVDYELEPAADGVESGAGDGDDTDAARIDRVLVDRKGREVPYRASEYVLATGGLVGKGIRSRREPVPTDGVDDAATHGTGDDPASSPAYRSSVGSDGAPAEPRTATGSEVDEALARRSGRVFEPIFDCHVPHAPDRYDWFVDDAFGDQPFARYGLTVDRELRPLDGEGDLEFSNLRAAGAVLGGYDYAAEKSGSGVSLATGYVAGSRAGERATEDAE
ncbi:glycerol-3-phosphate dehydrogenase subunit GlpB [Natrononativus amylolyticus]|uniref:glycerol-3-phosphate dehydrogenase subunit GlpB n=1 Tax=Natrononativus amylolyticus TaxID=2963434 RepID=UPI0020CDB924|nr:glycerol-3-phosphate dehydrogenase subunit GlpB [Natrononativus amylolyticus]